MINSEFFWLLFGVLLAVFAQVLYDLFGEVFKILLDKNKDISRYSFLPKFFGGMLVFAVIGFVLWVILYL
ncbi:MAG: hypothetical protein ABSG33_07485 [Candidatus Bathyarchaeia archaeon]|jgi:hypothetical protein